MPRESIRLNKAQVEADDRDGWVWRSPSGKLWPETFKRGKRPTRVPVIAYVGKWVSVVLVEVKAVRNDVES